MIACHRCGFDAPDDFAFCPKCGNVLAAPLPTLEERKVVTTLFCDLVGFTAMSEGSDPEDVDAILRLYHAAARKVIESHGGAVEKFIGDAVVGVFGVPAVHEDDPERAVRAALRTVEALEGMTRPDASPLEARVGVNTGEALVRLDVVPGSGEGFLTGDAVNTAARLQAAAPPMGVAVGALTRKLSERAIAYEELPAVVAKGKADPIAAWLATGPVARRGIGGDVRDLSPFVGRKVELAYLAAMFEKASVHDSPQFALLVGEPGIGKSRLVRELLAHVDAQPSMTTWRQGYCPPFGEDVTYWALTEIVKGHAGVLDTDEPDTVEAKLEAVLPDAPDREWLRQRLGALVGLPAPEASREENFAAWMRFFEEVASKRPIVIAFEDLHWADEALLSFVEYLAAHLASVPLMLIGTSRPELFERHPGFASGVRINRVGLEPLSTEETTRLVAGLLGDQELQSSAISKVVQRCDGNPFYAEQSARLLGDSGTEAALPDSVHAVIAARLDTLPPAQKALLGDAAVIGSVFWNGAVAALGSREADGLEGELSALLERRLIRRIRESSMGLEREFAFVHALARDVAYQQLPRRARALKHAAAARWLEAKTADRTDDLADVLAYHYVTALELAQAVGDAALRAPLLDAALPALMLAGARARDLDAAAAERHFARALAIADPGDAGRPPLLAHWGMTVAERGRFSEAIVALEEAIPQLQAAGENRCAAEALIYLSQALESSGRPTAHAKYLEAVALLGGDQASRELAFVLRFAAVKECNLGHAEVALELAGRALSAAAGLDRSVRANESEYEGALSARGIARVLLGDAGGLDDLRVAAETGLEKGFDMHRVGNYAGDALVVEGPLAVEPLFSRYIDLCRDRALHTEEVAMREGLLEAQCHAGHWDEALASAEELARIEQAGEDVLTFIGANVELAILMARRGLLDRALPLANRSLEAARRSEVPLMMAGALISAGTVFATVDEARARELLAELPDVLNRGFVTYGVYYLPEMLRTARLVGPDGVAEQLNEMIQPRLPTQVAARTYGDALLAEAHGRHAAAVDGFADAATSWRNFGIPYEEAQSLLGRGRCLTAIEEVSRAATSLETAREIFARLGAGPALAEVDEWLTRPHQT